MTTSAKWRPVHQHVDVAPHQPGSGEQDEHGDEQRRQRVCAGITPGDEQQTAEDRGGTRQVAPEVQRIRLQGRARVLLRRAPGHEHPARIDHHHDRDHRERVPRRLHVGLGRADEVRDRSVGDEEAGEDEDRCLGERGEMLGLAVPVRMARVRGAARDPEGEERQQSGDEVGARVHRLGDEPEAAARQARAELEPDEHKGREHGHERGSPLRRHQKRLSAKRAA
jgi:hypothetical protein